MCNWVIGDARAANRNKVEYQQNTSKNNFIPCRSGQVAEYYKYVVYYKYSIHTYITY